MSLVGSLGLLGARVPKAQMTGAEEDVISREPDPPNQVVALPKRSVAENPLEVIFDETIVVTGPLYRSGLEWPLPINIYPRPIWRLTMRSERKRRH